MPDPIEIPSNSCPGCNGTGLVNGVFCYPCMGTGFVSSIGMSKFLKAQFDLVKSEQAAQREDLTAVLTAIWNKVKDL